MKETNKKQTKHEWRQRYNDLEIRETSGFFQASTVMRPNPKPSKVFKSTPRELSSQLNQTLTGHGYTGEYYKKMNITEHPFACPCSPDGVPILQTRDHIIRACPYYEKHRPIIIKQFPRLGNPRFPLASLFKSKAIPWFLVWLKLSGAFTKRGIPFAEFPHNPHDPGPNGPTRQ